MKTQSYAALPFFLLLTACPPPQGPPPAPPEQEQSYTASGNEPGWRLIIQPDQIAYIGDYGETEITVDTPAALPGFNGHRYVTSQMTIDISHTPCDDTMVDRRYSDTVLLKIGKQQYRGCGGAILPPETLDSTSWVFEQIGGKPVASNNTRRGNELIFSDGSLSGTIGCNLFSGSFKVSGNHLEIGPVAATEMACGGMIGEQEAILFRLLGNRPEFGFDWLGHMTLKQGGTIVKLKRSF